MVLLRDLYTQSQSGTIIRFINANVILKITILLGNLNGKQLFRTSQLRADQTNSEDMNIYIIYIIYIIFIF